MDLAELGWNSELEGHFRALNLDGCKPGRVAREDRKHYLVYTEVGELLADVTGKLRHGAASKGELPAVGDWVAVVPRVSEGRGTIQAVLPRSGCFVRKEAGVVTEEQVLAANVDTAFLVTGLDDNFNVRRIERYLTLAWESGASPVVVLNKADLCEDVQPYVDEVEAVAVGVPVLALSALAEDGVEALDPYLERARTVVFLGSSGVGKSTIINLLLGEDRLKVGAVREDDSRGRHTTTNRELHLLPGGALVIDTPGMRELQLWGTEEGLERAFADVESLAEKCRFRDCGHTHEPGCAVRAAVSDGTLDAKRLQSYDKLKRELEHLALRQDDQLRRRVNRERGKMINQYLKELKQFKDQTGHYKRDR
jgi:ribosome biogenesis GTPase